MRGPIVGIANGESIAWVCAAVFRAAHDAARSTTGTTFYIDGDTTLTTRTKSNKKDESEM